MSRHLHYWLDTGIPHPLVFLTGKWRYDCSVCDKKIWRREKPINPLVKSEGELYQEAISRGGAHLVMSPLLRPSGYVEPDFIEGERYARSFR